jgi:hypothetical protein
MKTATLLLLAGLLLPAAARAEKLLDCNIGFGDLSQIQIAKEGGQMSYRVLTTSGSWKSPQPLPTEQWTMRDINFDFKTDHYHLSSPKGKYWQYEIFSFGSKTPNTTGGLDCD